MHDAPDGITAPNTARTPNQRCARESESDPVADCALSKTKLRHKAPVTSSQVYLQ